MSLEELGNIGEFVGAVGVVVSLVYLAYQIRQNTGALHSSAYAQTVEQAWLLNLAIAQDPALARAWGEVMAGNSLTLHEEIQFSAGLSVLFYAMENCFRQFERGLVDLDTWENVVANSLTELPPTVWERWRARKGPLTKRLLLHLQERGIPGAAA